MNARADPTSPSGLFLKSRLWQNTLSYRDQTKRTQDLMGSRIQRARQGDVFEIRLGKSLAFIQYIGKHPGYGDAIRVCRTSWSARPPLTEETFAQSYVTFYPLSAALKQGLVERIANLPHPPVPLRLRRPGAMTGREIKTWILEGPEGEVLRTALSDQDLELPIAGICNHEYLLKMISADWHPALARTNLAISHGAPQEGPRSPATPNVAKDVVHHLYFHDVNAADRAADDLARQGFAVSINETAEGGEWSVRACQSALTENLSKEDAVRVMELVARIGRGEYDGSETAVDS